MTKIDVLAMNIGRRGFVLGLAGLGATAFGIGSARADTCTETCIHLHDEGKKRCSRKHKVSGNKHRGRTIKKCNERVDLDFQQCTTTCNGGSGGDGGHSSCGTTGSKTCAPNGTTVKDSGDCCSNDDGGRNVCQAGGKYSRCNGPHDCAAEFCCVHNADSEAQYPGGWGRCDNPA